MKKHYIPFLTEETKQLILERNTVKSEFNSTGNPILGAEFKVKAAEVKAAVKKDKKEHFKNKTGHEASSKSAWKVTRELLGMTKNLSPTSITIEENLESNPTTIANTFNKFFINKVKELKRNTRSTPKIDPIQRLRHSLMQRNITPPLFQLKPIDKKTLRSILHRMKNKRNG